MLVDKRQQFSINGNLIQPHTHHCPDLCPVFSSISSTNPGLIMCLAFPNMQPTSAHSLLNHQFEAKAGEGFLLRVQNRIPLQYHASMSPLVFEWHWRCRRAYVSQRRNTHTDILNMSQLAQHSTHPDTNFILPSRQVYTLNQAISSSTAGKSGMYLLSSTDQPWTRVHCITNGDHHFIFQHAHRQTFINTTRQRQRLSKTKLRTKNKPSRHVSVQKMIWCSFFLITFPSIYKELFCYKWLRHNCNL